MISMILVVRNQFGPSSTTLGIFEFFGVFRDTDKKILQIH